MITALGKLTQKGDRDHGVRWQRGTMTTTFCDPQTGNGTFYPRKQQRTTPGRYMLAFGFPIEMVTDVRVWHVRPSTAVQIVDREQRTTAMWGVIRRRPFVTRCSARSRKGNAAASRYAQQNPYGVLEPFSLEYRRGSVCVNKVAAWGFN